MGKQSIPSTTIDAIDSLLTPHGVNIRLLLQETAPKSHDSLDGKKWLTVAQAERYSGIGRFTLRRLKDHLISSKLSPAKSGKVVYLKESLDAFLTSKIQGPKK